MKFYAPEMRYVDGHDIRLLIQVLSNGIEPNWVCPILFLPVDSTKTIG